MRVERKNSRVAESANCTMAIAIESVGVWSDKSSRIGIVPESNYTLDASALHSTQLNLSEAARQSSLGEQPVELINLRISQINGCGFGADMH